MERWLRLMRKPQLGQNLNSDEKGLFSNEHEAIDRTRVRELVMRNLGISNDTFTSLPGLVAYCDYLEYQCETLKEPFEELLGLMGYTLPIAKDDILQLLIQIVEALKRIWPRTCTMNIVLKELLQTNDHCLQGISKKQARAIEKVIIRTIAWLNLMYRTESVYLTACFGSDYKMDVHDELFYYELNFKDNQPDLSATDGYGSPAWDEPMGLMISHFCYLYPSETDVHLFLESKPRPLIHAENLNVATLSSICNLKIRWTDVLGEHLVLDPHWRELCIFRYPTFCVITADQGNQNTTVKSIMDKTTPDACAYTHYTREVLYSFLLLFGRDSKSRKFYQDALKETSALPGKSADPLLDMLCGSKNPGKKLRSFLAALYPMENLPENFAEKSAYNINADFHVLSKRLHDLQEFSLQQQPVRLRAHWHDRRNPLQWLAFWAVLIVGGVTILLGLIQLAVAILGLVPAWKSLEPNTIFIDLKDPEDDFVKQITAVIE